MIQKYLTYHGTVLSLRAISNLASLRGILQLTMLRLIIQVLLLLILSFWVSYYLKVRRIRSIHETIVALFAGKFAPYFFGTE